MPLGAAIVAAVSTGALSGQTQASNPALAAAYHHLKALLSQKFGSESELVHAINAVEAKPDSAGRQATLQEEIAAAQADQDQEVLQVAQTLLHLLQPISEGGPHVQTAMGSYIAQADRGSSASVTIGRLRESSRRGDRL